MKSSKPLLITSLLLSSLFITLPGFAQNTSFAGTEIPKSVTELMEKAKTAGVVFYDVKETKKDGSTKWNPYEPTTEAYGNMEFSYTEITPQKLEDDKNTNETSNWIVGYTSETADDGSTYEIPVLESKAGGTGNVLAQYDEASHEDLFARGQMGQKWANNCGILEDGSIHCLPAARHNETSDYILTNPDLSRGKLMLYNGHIDIQNGLVVGVEMSGKLSKFAASGKYKFINPIAVLKAWGFQLSPDLKIYFGNTEDGTPSVTEITIEK